MHRLREVSPADIYHVTSRGTARQIIFENDEDRKYLLALILQFSRECGAELYAWCFMSNHIHMLVHQPLEELARFMKRLLGVYARAFNERRERAGHLFHERYSSEAINDDTYLLTVIRYIHQNPEVAGIAPTADYQWSSYSEYVGVPSICKTEFPLSVFGGKDAFIQFHQTLDDGSSNEDGTICQPKLSDSDDAALVMARELIGVEPDRLKTLPKPQRDQLLSKLRSAGLSIRRIERLTGIGRGVIARVHVA